MGLIFLQPGGMRNVPRGTGELSAGLCTMLAFPVERIVALRKSLLHLLQRVLRNLLVFINVSKCLVWVFTHCITTIDPECNTSLIAA